MRSLSRRTFLQAVAAAPLMAAIQFPTEPRDRLAVTSYPFRSLIESPTNTGRDKSKPGMDLKDFPRLIAKRFGIFNVNPVGDHLSSTDAAYLKDFRMAVESAGSHVVDLGVAGHDFSNAGADAVTFGIKWIDIAVQIGSPSIRPHLKGATPSVDKSAESLARLAEYGSKKNIIVNLENDAPGAEDPFFIAEVVGKVNSPFLRALPDFGNSLRGHDAAYNKKAVDGMLKYAYNMCHVKDVLRTKDGQVYKVDIPGMFALARANNYKGYFSMEFDTAAGDPFAGTESLARQSVQYM
jgi:sugar phosphate isomerase/epimerase